MTNDTFFNYFDANGFLLSNVTADELEFDGDFSGVNVTTISIDRSVNFIGKNATFDGVSIYVVASNVTIDGFTFIQTNSSNLISANLVENVTLSNNLIYYHAVEGKDSYAIMAYAINNLKLINNTIAYVGNTDGSKFNYAVFIEGLFLKNDFYEVEALPSTNILLDNNVFNIAIPSVDIEYGASFNAISYSEGIVFYACENVTFTNNELNVEYNNVTGYSDTIKALSVKSNANIFTYDDDGNLSYPMISKNIKIFNNKFKVAGHQYAYGLYLAAENFEVSYNVFNVDSDDYYANAINIEGPSFQGIVNDNLISVNASISYGVYTYQYYGAVKDIEYSDNYIFADGYGACGMELAECSPYVYSNVIVLDGNYTWGIVSSVRENGTFADNGIWANSTGVGNVSSGDPLLPLKSMGMSIKGNSLIGANTIFTQDVGINLVEDGNIALVNNHIHVNATGDCDSYAVYAKDIGRLDISSNEICLEGKSNGSIIANAVHVVKAGDVNVNGNNITASANTCSHAIHIIGSNFTVSDNIIESSDADYANGIYVEGPAVGSIQENLISVNGIESVGIEVISAKASVSKNDVVAQGKGVSLTEGSVELSENNIAIVANDDADAYAIYAKNIYGLNITGNTVIYQGATKGKGINYAVHICNVTEAAIDGNIFNLSLVSSNGHLVEIPEGSGNFTGVPLSQGIVIESSDEIEFSNNNVTVNYTDVIGTNDVICAVSVISSCNILIEANNVTTFGHTYAEGIIILADNFVIKDNSIHSESDNADGVGIDISGPSSGIIDNNVIAVKGVNYAICIYSNGDGKNVSTWINNNMILAQADTILALGLNTVESIITANQFMLVGNYTTGITFSGDKLIAVGNMIMAIGSLEGDSGETIGIKVLKGNAEIMNNSVIPNRDYAIDVCGNNASVHDNYLLAGKFTGDESVKNAENAVVYNNTPVFNDTDKYPTAVVITEVCGNGTIRGILTENGTPYMDSLSYSFAGVNGTVNTDRNGVFQIDNVPNGKITITYLKDSYRLSSSASIILTDLAPLRAATVINAEEYHTYAVDYYAGERGNYFKVQLVDADGNPLANKSVKIGFNGVVYTKETNATGWAELQINLAGAGTYTFAVAFLGDDDYNASFVVQKIVVTKKKTNISASAKTFQASAKTKSYTVTLKTDKGSSIDGKAYLQSGKKITLKINGKTYTAKTNSKGQATFKLSITKKGKFVTAINFGGDKTYEASSKSVKITIK